MRNPFKENKGFPDHLAGGTLWVSIMMFIVVFLVVGDDFIPLAITLGCLVGFGIEVYQIVKATDVTWRLLIDSTEDFIGEVFTGALTYLILINLIGTTWFYLVNTIIAAISILWLAYSSIYRWRFFSGK